MRGFRFIEYLFTKFLIPLIALIIIAIPATFITILRFNLVDLDSLATMVDVVFKTVALIIGAAWALNRFYTTRVDAKHLQVNADVSCIHSFRAKEQPTDHALLIYRLDILNTGKTILEPFQHYVEVQGVTFSNDSIQYITIHRWPEKGMHSGGPIEPGSWSAVNDAIAVPDDLQAIRLFVYVDLNKDDKWTWHKTFKILDETKSEEMHYRSSGTHGKKFGSTKAAGNEICPGCGEYRDLHTCSQCERVTICRECWKNNPHCPNCGA